MVAAGVESRSVRAYGLPPCPSACPGNRANKQRITAVEATILWCGDSLSWFRSSISKRGLNITNSIGYLDSRCRIIDANDCQWVKAIPPLIFIWILDLSMLDGSMLGCSLQGVPLYKILHFSPGVPLHLKHISFGRVP